MKKIVIILITILFSGILFAQTSYDPLTDPNVQKPANPALFLENMRVMRRLEILKGTAYTRAEFQAFLDDFEKAKAWRSTIQKVVVRNNLGNSAEIEEKYEIAKQQYYQVVWNKNDYNGYHTDDPIVGFYYFKTCYDLGRLLLKWEIIKTLMNFILPLWIFIKQILHFIFLQWPGLMG